MVRKKNVQLKFDFIFNFSFIDNKSLSDPMRVKELRRRIQVNLETYINQQRPLMRGRFGELLLLLPPLQNISRLMVDLVARYNHDTKQVDDLINEMLLSKFKFLANRRVFLHKKKKCFVKLKKTRKRLIQHL